MDKIRPLLGSATCAVVVVLFACASGASTQFSPASGLAVQPTVAAIQPGDLVRVRIWREPDLSGEFPVDETGSVVLPRLGSLSATGSSAQAFRARIVSAYEVFLSHSSVEVTLLRRLQVLGAVRNPGLYQLDPTMTVEDGLALAGGATPEGNPNRMELIRHGEKLPVQLTLRTQINSSAIRSGDQLYVPERSWTSRNPGVIVGGFSVIATTLVLLLRR
jgi:polysaccharide export outer membrane protein